MSQRVRAIFLSDIHLGTRACQADRLLDFLKAYESDYIFLVGDILDFWAMRSRGIYWSATQNTVLQKLLKRARHHVQIVFIPGNHDEAVREHAGTSFGNIRVVMDYVHVAADAKRYLLLHGDEFDQVTRYHRWIAVLGDHAYAALVRLNLLLSWLRRTIGVPGYWSLSGYAKRRVKTALDFVFGFEEAVARHAKERGVDGVICGHIHVAAIRDVNGIRYVNCGDWVDSCTAIVEHGDGQLELVRWGTPPRGGWAACLSRCDRYRIPEKSAGCNRNLNRFSSALHNPPPELRGENRAHPAQASHRRRHRDLPARGQRRRAHDRRDGRGTARARAPDPARAPPAARRGGPGTRSGARDRALRRHPAAALSGAADGAAGEARARRRRGVRGAPTSSRWSPKVRSATRRSPPPDARHSGRVGVPHQLPRLQPALRPRALQRPRRAATCGGCTTAPTARSCRPRK